MEDFSFRPSFEVEKVPPNFFSSALNYLDSLDHTKGLRPDQIPNPLQVAHEFRRRRLSSFEAPVFYPYKDEEHFPEAHDHVKTENFTQEFPQFGHHAHTDFGFEFPMSTKLQDCAVDYYRINRSRGPSFNWGPGRKNSEDLFAHGFDLLYRNFEQQNVPQELNDSKMHPTFLDAPLIPQALAGNFNSLAENNYHNHLQMQFENGHPKELATNLHQVQTGQQQPPQSAYEDSQEEKTSDLEAKGKKKRKTNNRQEAPVEEEAEPPVVKKVKSDNKKNAKAAEPALKSSKSMIEKPVAKKTESKSTKSKKGLEAQRTDSSFVKSEVEDQEKEEKSTEASSINVSPVPKKEDIPNIFRSKSSIAGTFGHFKKPETAQELLGGLSLPAEVEEYINNSKIFNQIKAPIIKKIGTLTLEERRIKIEKYLEKRKRRSWNKRVNYDCRKKVADNRLRIKGRFVTKDQAFSMLEACGIFPDPEKITNNEIKELLTERFGSILKKKDLFGDGQAKQGKSGKGVKAEENNKQFQFGDMGGDQDGSSVGSQDDSMSETYLRD